MWKCLIILKDNFNYETLAIEANYMSVFLDIMPGVVPVQINSVNVDLIVWDVQEQAKQHLCGR